MAKVLLINSNRFRHPWPVIPFGLLYVAANLEDKGCHKVQFLDLCFSLNCEADIRNSIRSFVPDIIGISIRNIDDTGGYNVHFLLEDVRRDVVEYCRTEFRGPIVIGGPSVGISGREMLEYFNLEYAISGDGEAAMTEFVNRFENQKSFEGIQGLIIRRENIIIQDSEPSRVSDLDSLSIPKPLRYLNLEPYRKSGSPINIQTKRGCALHCSYCTYNKIEGNNYRLRNPEIIADEIETLVKETGINHIDFTDSVFNIPLTHTKEVLKHIISKHLDLRLNTMGLSPASVDEELLDLMKEAGFNEAGIGAESLCDEILASLSKDFRCRDIIKTADLLKKKDIPATWFIMLGALAETAESVNQTLNKIGRLASKRDMVFISTGIRIYNGAPIADFLMNKNTRCTNDNFFRPVKIEPGEINLHEINSIAKRLSYRFPNFYFYEKEHVIGGWMLRTGNSLLKILHSRQPVWRLLIVLRRIAKLLGIDHIKMGLFKLKLYSSREALTTTGFSIIKND